MAFAGADGQLTWGVHVSLAPVWFDPADISGIITPFMVLYAMHDAMVKPMPAPLSRRASPKPGRHRRTASPTTSPCARATLFHNGDPVTAEDVRYTYQRYRGTAHDLMMERVARSRCSTRGGFVSSSSGRGPIF